MTELYKGDHTKGEIELLEEQVIFQNRFVTHYNDRVRFPGGTEGFYLRSRWNCSYGVCVVPITDDGKLILIRNFRHGLRAWTWELIKGFGVEEMTPESCAAMELQEEAGFAANQWQSIRTLGHEGLKLHMFLAKSLYDVDMKREAEEAISDVGHFDKDAARDLMFSSECEDPLTIGILAMFVGDMLLKD